MAGIMAFLMVSTVMSLFVCLMIRPIWIAIPVATVISSIAFQVAGFLVLGFLDPFWQIALITSLVPSFIVATCISVLVHLVRRKRFEKEEV